MSLIRTPLLFSEVVNATASASCVEPFFCFGTSPIYWRDMPVKIKIKEGNSSSTQNFFTNLYKEIDYSALSELLQDVQSLKKISFASSNAEKQKAVTAQLERLLPEELSDDSHEVKDAKCAGMQFRDVIPSNSDFYSTLPASGLHTDYLQRTNSQKYLIQYLVNRRVSAYPPFKQEFITPLLEKESTSLRFVNFWISLDESPSSNTLILARKIDPSVTYPKATVVSVAGSPTKTNSVFIDDILNERVELHGALKKYGQGYIFDSQNVPHAGVSLSFKEVDMEKHEELRKLIIDRHSFEVRCSILVEER